MNRNFLLFPLFLIMLWSAVSAQDSIKKVDSWKYSFNTNLTLTLNNYSDNWAGSEVSSFSWGWKLDGSAEKALTPWFKNVNTLKLAFGQTALQKKDETSDTKKWDSMKKSSDLIDLEIAGRFTLKSFVNPFISARVISQFADFRTENDHYFNPAEITESFGAIRDIIKNDYVDWTARLGGAVRQSVERNSTVRAVSKTDKVVNDGGLEFLTDFAASSKDNRITYKTQFKLFEALFFAEDSIKSVNENKRHPDISWENTLDVSLLKYVMLNIYFQLLYDKEIDSAVRFRQTSGLALTYNIKSAD